MKLKSAVITTLFCLVITLCFGQSKPKNYHLIIGTYTKTQTKGLFVYKFDTETGKLSFESATEGVVNPSYLVVNNSGTKVYSVSEAGDKKSGVSAFNFDAKAGKLSFINSEETKSNGPCYVNLSNDEKFLFTANYGGGSLSAFPLNTDGSLKPLSQLVKHTGESINKSRQTAPHAHSVRFSPDGNILFAADLGTDYVYAYNYNPNSLEPLNKNLKSDIKIAAGHGPRHFEFNTKGDKLYVLGELEALISVFSYQNNESKLEQTISLNNSDFKGTNGAADIHLSNDGKFLYATNRGSINELVAFKINKKNGKLTKIQSVSTKGKTPRNFVIDPTDNFLLVANQNSDDIYVFKRDKKTGLLTYNNEMIKIGAPVCLKFVGVK